MPNTSDFEPFSRDVITRGKIPDFYSQGFEDIHPECKQKLQSMQGIIGMAGILEILVPLAVGTDRIQAFGLH